MILRVYNVIRIAIIAFTPIALVACGGGGSSSPPPPPVSVGGTVTGLDAGESVVLQLNGGNDLTVRTNGPFTFASKVSSGGVFVVALIRSPVGKTCDFGGYTGTAWTNVTSVTVACSKPPPYKTYRIGGTVSGLVGTGLELALQVRGRCTYTLCVHTLETLRLDRNGDFSFATPQPPNDYYLGITRQPQTPVQRCALSSSNPVFITAADVTDVKIVCSEFAYVANAAGNTISAFSIDATTGAIAPAGSPVTAGKSPVAIALTNNKKYVYAANSGSNDVSAYTVDPGTGALTAVPGSPFAAHENPRALAFFFGFLYVANTGSSDISVYQIDFDSGALTPSSPASVATGAGPSTMAIAPGGPYLYTANAGGSSISAFAIDTVNGWGWLGPVPGSPLKSGNHISSLAFGAAGSFLYAADASGATAAILAYAVRPYLDQQGMPDPNAGALSPLPGFPLPLPACTFIVTDQTNTYLYATTATELRGYRIDATSGALSPLSGFPIALGAEVRSVSIDPANQFLYVANGTAGTVSGYTLNAATGALIPMLGSPFTVGTSADSILTL